MSTLQWRNENVREPRSFGEEIRIGSGSHAVDAYLANSQRVGPGLLILGPSLDENARGLVDACREEGFTALAPDLTGTSPEGVVKEGAEMLVANWHPRVGVLALPGTGDLAIVIDGIVRLDALVVTEGETADATPRAPGLAADLTTEDGLREALDFLSYHLS